MAQPMFRKSTLVVALVSLGLAAGVSAQSTAQQPSGGTAATSAPPASGSTGMNKDKAARPSAGKSDNAQVSSSERRFMEHAARGGMAEVEMGKLAQEKAESQQVKDFGKRMVEDHGKANDELKRLAANKGVTLPTDMDGSHKRKIDKLSKLSGDKFDREYMDEMVDDHEKDVREFRSMAKSAKDADVKSFASTTLPVLEQHLSLAKSAEDAVKQARRSGSGSTARAPGSGPTTAASGNGASRTRGMANGTSAGADSSARNQSTPSTGTPSEPKTASPSK